MKNQLSLLLVFAVILGCTNQANAADATDTGRVSAVVELSDGELQTLLQTGTFKMSIPRSYKNKVNSLILKRPDRFKDEVAVLFNDVDKRSNTIAISIDDSTIEQIAFQPVELKIYESGYTNILVHYRPGNGAEVKEPSKTDSVELKVLLTSGKTLTGRLSYMTQFPLKSALGKVKVKLEDVSQISFDEDGELKVMMFNGDTLRGESNFSSILVNTRWGQEKIDIEDIASIAAPLTPELSVSNATIPSVPLQNWSNGPANQYNSVGSVLPPAMNQTNFDQPFQQYQFPMESGRVDTVPGSPRQVQPYSTGQPLPMQSFFGDQGQRPYQVPMSEFPISDSLMGQPLPLMNPNQANDYWLFPQN